MQGTAARLDDLLAGSVGAALRRDLAVPVDKRGDDYVQASFGAWTVVAVVLLVASLLIDAQSWLVSVGLAVVIGAARSPCTLMLMSFRTGSPVG